MISAGWKNQLNNLCECAICLAKAQCYLAYSAKKILTLFSSLISYPFFFPFASSKEEVHSDKTIIFFKLQRYLSSLLRFAYN